MKEAVIHSARRRESSRSLEVDASSSSSTSSPSSSSSFSSSSFTYPSIPRRASTQSLKTVRSLDQSPIKEEEECEKSLSLKRSLTRKLSFFFEAEQSSSPSSSSGWNHGLSSLSYLKTMGALGLSPGKKQTTGDNNEQPSEEEESDTLKKRLSRRLSSLFDGVSTGGNSDAVSSSPASSPIPDSSNISELRGVKRGDLPICWIESLNASSPATSISGQNPPSLDLLSRLASRVYTRHLAREILQHLSKQVKY